MGRRPSFFRLRTVVNFFPVEGMWVFTDPDSVRLARPSGYYRAFLRPIVP